LVLLLAAGCRPEPGIKIGLVAPFEGRERAVGYDAIYAARLAVREINAAGGIDGRKVALVALDDGDDASRQRATAAGLTLDRDVIAVVEYDRASTPSAGNDVYQFAGVPFVALGIAPFAGLDPETLPDEFVQAYNEVTPFHEQVGLYSAATYDAFYLLFEALRVAESQGNISREGVTAALDGLEYSGLTGRVFRP
jgi:ABC-type branched-subunit amino acid transport system substrate-binding protein